MDKGTYFGKEETVGVGALMVILMMIHHLFNFPKWLEDGNSWQCLTLTGTRITEILALFGICVNVFAMISGYALWIKPSAYGSWGARTKRIFRVLTSYWLICALFLAVGFVSGSQMPSLQQLGANLLGFENGPSKGWAHVPFAWYIAFYIEFVLLTPVITWMFSGRKPWHDALAFLTIVTIVRFRHVGFPVTQPIWILTSAAAGVLIAKYDVIERLGRSVMSRIHWAVLLMAIPAMAVKFFLFSRINIIGANWGIIVDFNRIICAFIVLMASIGIFRGAGQTIRRLLLLMGGVGLEMWLMHGLFFMGTCPGQQIIYSLRHPVLILAVTIIICLPLSVAVSRCAGWIFKNIPIFLRTFAVRSTN